MVSKVTSIVREADRLTSRSDLWQGTLADSSYFYAMVRNDRLAVGLGIAPNIALRAAIGCPYIDTFMMRRDGWLVTFPTTDLLEYLVRYGFDVSSVNAEEVEAQYQSHNAKSA
jgi:hypothetical protein